MKKPLFALFWFAAVGVLPAFAVPAEARAIIIVPGTTATELMADGKAVWPPEIADASIKDFHDLLSRVSRSVDGLQSLACDEKGDSLRPIVPVRMTPWRPPATGNLGIGNFYGELVEALRTAFGTESVYFFGYDWRLDNDRSASELDVFIRQVQRETGARKVDIVAHSMGGIVVAAYLGRYGEAGNVDRTVFLGTPFLGSAEAFCVLAGTDLSLLTYMPEGLKPLVTKETTSVHQIMKGMERVTLELARAFPSVYELLPAREREELSRLGGPGASLSSTAQARIGAVFAREMVRGLPKALSHTRVCNIVGADFQTVGEAEVYPGASGDVMVRTKSTDGDGVVSLESATAGGLLAPFTKRFPVRHEALVTDKHCIDSIIEELSRP